MMIKARRWHCRLGFQRCSPSAGADWGSCRVRLDM